MNPLEIGNGDSNTPILLMCFGSKVIRLLNLHLDAREKSTALPKKAKVMFLLKNLFQIVRKGLGVDFFGG